MAGTIDRLMIANATESQARIQAEKDSAVLVSKLESELERMMSLLQENEALLDQVAEERQAREALRIEAAKITSELDLLKATFVDRQNVVTKLTESCEAERNACVAAEKRAAVLTTRLEEQGKAISRLHKLLPSKTSKNNVQSPSLEGSGNQANIN